MRNPYRYFNSSPEVIRLAVLMYIRYPLSLRQVEDILFERGIDICHETVRYWWNRFGPMFASEIRKRRVHHRSFSHWRWHLDEVFVRINGETHYLWRAVDHEGEVLEVLRALRRDRRAALKFLKRTMKRYGRPRSIVTDRLRSYRAAMKVIGNVTSQECGLVLNFVPDKERALQEMRRIVEPGGTVAAYVWDYAGEMQLIRYFWDAVGELFPDAAAHDEGKQFPICNPESLAGLFSAAGLQEVETCALDAPTVC